MSIENVSPRLGTRSNLSCQDIVVVAMILAGRKFDLPDLILKNMMDSIEGKSSGGLPYGLLLTRVFEWFGVPFEDEETVSAKEFLDVKFLAQSNLKLDKDGNLVVVEIPVPSPVHSVGIVDLGISAKEIHAYMEELRANHRQVIEGQKQLSEQIHELGSQSRFWNQMVFGDKSGNTSEKCSSANTSLLYELYKFRQMYGSGGSSDIKRSAGTEHFVEDSPNKGPDAAAIDLEARKAEIAAKMDAAKDDADF